MLSLSWWEYLLLVITGALTGAIAAFLLTVTKDWIEKRKRIKGYLSSLDAEIDECHRIARLFPQISIASPLYRLPTYFYQQSLPGLLADGALKGIEPKVILHFFTEVETANRGLDRADLLLTQGTLQATSDERTHSPVEIPRHIRRAVWEEYGRITLKTRRIVRLYPLAKAVTSTPRPDIFKMAWARLTDAFAKVPPSKVSYLRACEHAGQLLSERRHSILQFYRKIRNRKRHHSKTDKFGPDK